MGVGEKKTNKKKKQKKQQQTETYTISMNIVRVLILRFWFKIVGWDGHLLNCLSKR